GNSGIDWKVGVFDTIIGYESSSSPLDPNYTRSYGYTIEPTTHTGILGTYKVNDMLSISAGVADALNSDNGTFNGINNNSSYESQKTYMGAIALTGPDSWGVMKGTTINGGIIDSVDSASQNGSTTSYYLGATIPTPLQALKVGAAFDYLSFHQSASPGEVWVVGLYASYQINDKASLNVRGEIADDDWGLLYGFNSPGVSRNRNEELTVDLQYNLWANVISRAEFRWDHVEHGKSFGAHSGSGANTRGNDFLLALNVIYQF
ncbi:MAG TPA: outer membrane beta-barrel protein, partial [Candidatus Baltobacteraceae bacterium]|nr:outer membrane beta-barrel protein [Candidatus Baltobacteraceae bacterium]